MAEDLQNGAGVRIQMARDRVEDDQGYFNYVQATLHSLYYTHTHRTAERR